MNNPTSQQVAVILRYFEKVLPIAEEDEQLDMSEGNVNTGRHVCGTAHCHAGWFAIAACNLNKALDYMDGARKMAHILGFESIYELRIWAKQNAEIWDNQNGPDMFSSSSAFTPGDKTHASNLRDIYDHWAEVHDRIWLEANYLKN